MARRQTPPQWQALMEQAGFSSIRRLAEASGLTHSGVTRAIHGETVPGDDTVTAMAKALRVPAKEIYKLTHGQEIQSRPWEPPAEVQRLTKREQDAVTEMIRAMAAGREEQKDVMGNAEHPAPMYDAAGTAAAEDPDDFDLAAHPYIQLDRDRFEEQHGAAGEESQDQP